MQNGWIKIYRKLVTNDLWLSEKFTRGQAWIDLLMLANHKDGFFFVRGIKVEIKRGQIGWSQEALAKRWRWSRNKVKRYFLNLETIHQTKQQKSNVLSLIEVINYNQYQSNESTNESTNDTTDGHQTDTNKKDKKEKNEKISSVRFAPPTQKEVEDYFIESRSTREEAAKFFFFYESKDWHVGKSKMKKWRSAASGWIARQNTVPVDDMFKNHKLIQNNVLPTI